MDEYERRHMSPEERVLFREKIVSRTAWMVSLVMAVIFGLFGLGLIGVGLFSSVPLAGGVIPGAASVALALFMGITGAMFSVFRSMVTTTHLHVHFGWTKKKIPYPSITAVRAVTTKGFRQGKVSIGLDGIVRTWVGTSSSNRAVEVEYTPEGGRKHILSIGSDDAEGFLRAIESARLGREEAEPQARIATDDAGVRIAESSDLKAADAEETADAEERRLTR